MPQCFVSDRELALINPLHEPFAVSNHILYRRHINMNVIAKTKGYFNDKDNFDKFYSAWNTFTYSKDLEVSDSNQVELLKQKLSVVKYVVNTWMVQREKILSAQTNISFFN